MAEGDANPERLLDLAAELFGADAAQVRKLLVRSYTHDWRTDTRCCGAYSYAPAGMMEMPELLAVPLAGTLYFAGEATDAEGTQGTVHGAINSGRRAASELLDSL